MFSFGHKEPEFALLIRLLVQESDDSQLLGKPAVKQPSNNIDGGRSGSRQRVLICSMIIGIIKIHSSICNVCNFLIYLKCVDKFYSVLRDSSSNNKHSLICLSRFLLVFSSGNFIYMAHFFVDILKRFI